MALVETCQHANQIPPGDPHHAALACWSLAHGLASLLLDNQKMLDLADPVDQSHLVDTTIELLMTGIAT